MLDFTTFVDSGFQFDFSLAGGAGAWDTSSFNTTGSLCFGSCGGNTDYNDDGTWNLGDLNLVLFNWQDVEANLPPTWIYQRPATVGLDSLNNVLFNWQRSASLASVPEPATVYSVGIGLLAVMYLKRRRWG